jgi:hypothetical protein
LTLLFNACLLRGYVPDAFGKGILFPLLKSSDLDSTCSANYRGITVSCVISKLFEICLHDLFGEHLYSSDLQFGFKKGIGTRDAILTARLSTSYLTDRGSTATLCALDISKAFDRVDHFCLLIKLLERGTPRIFIDILVSWFSKSLVRVRWGDHLSSSFTVSAGVRQGGVLSPFLFAVYIDVLITRLRASGYGLHICQCFLGCLVYADDILLIAKLSFSHAGYA